MILKFRCPGCGRILYREDDLQPGYCQYCQGEIDWGLVKFEIIEEDSQQIKQIKRIRG